MNATARNWGRKSVVTKHVLKSVRKDMPIVDFGAGKFQSQTKILRDEGFETVSPYDIGKTGSAINESPYGFRDLFPCVLMASNVLNVQPSTEKLDETLDDIVSFRPVLIVANYPLPRKLGLTFDEMWERLDDMTNYMIMFTDRKDNLIILNRHEA